MTSMLICHTSIKTIFLTQKRETLNTERRYYFFSFAVILGGSRKKIAKKMIPRVPTKRNV